ncbi:MAG: hypothetical protein ACFE0O_06150 [Opitutales bacterium]
MVGTPVGRLVALAVALLGLTVSLAGQDTPKFAGWVIDEPPAVRNYNLKLGPVYFDAVADFAVTYNSNVTVNGLNSVDDFIVRAGIRLGSVWELSQFNALQFNIGASYEQYLNNPELSSSDSFLNLTPDTEISGTFLIGDVQIRVFDKITFSADPTDAVARDPQTGDIITNVAQFGRFRNVLGLQVGYDFNAFQVSLQASRRDVWSLERQFNFTDRVAYLVAGNVSRAFYANLTAGLGASASWTDFETGINNDSRSVGLGPYVTYRPSEFIVIYVGLSANRQFVDFDSGTLTDRSEVDGLSGNVSISHLLNNHFNHRLSYTREFTDGFTSNFTRFDSLGYQFSLEELLPVNLRGNLSHEWGEDSGGSLPDDFTRFSASLRTSYPLAKRINLILNLGYTEKSSRLPGRSYDQLRVSLSSRYDF